MQENARNFHLSKDGLKFCGFFALNICEITGEYKVVEASVEQLISQALLEHAKKACYPN